MIYSNPQINQTVKLTLSHVMKISSVAIEQPPLKMQYFDNSSPINEQVFCEIPRSAADDIELEVDAAHFRYFAGCIRAQEGSIGEINNNTVAYHFHEPLGVIGQIIPWNFPLSMACWKLAPALAAGIGADVWTRDMNRSYRMGRGLQAGRVWTNCYHLYPAHAAFGGYKKSGIGRESHKMMLNHYQQTKNMLVSYDINPLVFF